MLLGSSVDRKAGLSVCSIRYRARVLHPRPRGGHVLDGLLEVSCARRRQRVGCASFGFLMARTTIEVPVTLFS